MPIIFMVCTTVYDVLDKYKNRYAAGNNKDKDRDRDKDKDS
jgi:hypothetical protein